VANKQWLAAREADLLPVEYYHVVFTLPAPIGQLAYTDNRAFRARPCAAGTAAGMQAAA
jgi:hypothetical protein